MCSWACSVTYAFGNVHSAATWFAAHWCWPWKCQKAIRVDIRSKHRSGCSSTSIIHFLSAHFSSVGLHDNINISIYIIYINIIYVHQFLISHDKPTPTPISNGCGGGHATPRPTRPVTVECGSTMAPLPTTAPGFRVALWLITSEKWLIDRNLLPIPQLDSTRLLSQETSSSNSSPFLQHCRTQQCIQGAEPLPIDKGRWMWKVWLEPHMFMPSRMAFSPILTKSQAIMGRSSAREIKAPRPTWDPIKRQKKFGNSVRSIAFMIGRTKMNSSNIRKPLRHAIFQPQIGQIPSLTVPRSRFLTVHIRMKLVSSCITAATMKNDTRNKTENSESEVHSGEASLAFCRGQAMIRKIRNGP